MNKIKTKPNIGSSRQAPPPPPPKKNKLKNKTKMSKEQVTMIMLDFKNKSMKTRKSKVITLRVTDEEKKLLELKARRTRKTLSAYILSKTIK